MSSEYQNKEEIPKVTNHLLQCPLRASDKVFIGHKTISLNEIKILAFYKNNFWPMQWQPHPFSCQPIFRRFWKSLKKSAVAATNIELQISSWGSVENLKRVLSAGDVFELGEWVIWARNEILQKKYLSYILEISMSRIFFHEKWKFQ